jgi:hypothetical protein
MNPGLIHETLAARTPAGYAKNSLIVSGVIAAALSAAWGVVHACARRRAVAVTFNDRNVFLSLPLPWMRALITSHLDSASRVAVFQTSRMLRELVLSAASTTTLDIDVSDNGRKSFAVLVACSATRKVDVQCDTDLPALPSCLCLDL